jgi:hypothetical protein
LNCVRGPGAHSYAAGTPVFFSKTTVGVIPARLIAENTIYQTISTKAVLTMLQREQGLVKGTNCTVTAYDRAMGYDFAADYNFVSQLYNGTRKMRDYINEGPQLPYYFDGRPPNGETQKKRSYYDTSTSSLKDIKLRVNNAATYSLFRYNVFVRYNASGMGNVLYFNVWLDFGF